MVLLLQIQIDAIVEYVCRARYGDFFKLYCGSEVLYHKKDFRSHSRPTLVGIDTNIKKKHKCLLLSKYKENRQLYMLLI